MKKYSWLFAILGVAALGLALMFAAAFGAGITYFFLQADPVQAAFAAPVDVENEEGVLISGVKPESAAAEVGLVRGDIVLEINGDPIKNIIEMKEVLIKFEPGDAVELTVLHGDEIRVLDVELDDAKGFAYLGVGTCNFSKGKKTLPGDTMFELKKEAFFMSAEVLEVVAGSPADEAGLQVGDVILSVDAEPISPKSDLADLIQAYAPGDVVTLKVQSGESQEAREVSVTLAEHPDKPGMAYLGVAYQAGMPDFKDGKFPFGEMPEGWDEDDFFFHHDKDFDGEQPEGWEENGEFYFHEKPFKDEEGLPFHHEMPELPEGVEGAVIISEVMEGTPASEADLQPGDLIIAIDDESVEEIEVFVDELQSRKPGDEVTFTIIRGGDEIEVEATLTEHPDDPDKGFLGVLAGTLIIMENMEHPEGFDQDFEFEIPGVPGGDA